MEQSSDMQTEGSQNDGEQGASEEAEAVEIPIDETTGEAAAEEDKTQEGQTQVGQADQSQNGTSDSGLEKAKEAALQDAGFSQESVTFTKAKKDYDDGREEYEIEFVTEDTKYEYEIAAEDGRILKSGQEPIQTIPEDIQTRGLLSVDEAKQAAVAAVGLDAGQVAYTKVELDYDDGRSCYEIEFYADGMEYSCELNASTGEVLEMEQEAS